ncbi:hypothetical protein BHE74_00027925 [Ensete ventricosum]|nr:hypothetical protein GW17_00042290 [Ensete ventricosum]RWW64810.1 hypothetical protein BHE74_00027925 [Ensete ventricosum]
MEAIGSRISTKKEERNREEIESDSLDLSNAFEVLGASVGQLIAGDAELRLLLSDGGDESLAVEAVEAKARGAIRGGGEGDGGTTGPKERRGIRPGAPVVEESGGLEGRRRERKSHRS